MTTYFLMTLLQRLPVLLVVCAGIMFAIVRWRRHPKASLLTLIALGFYLVKLLGFTAINYWIPILRAQMQWSYATANSIFTVLHVVNDIGFAVVIVLLVVAAFVSRHPVPATST